MPFKTDQIHPFNSNWKEVPAVYGMISDNNQVVYIGQTDNMKRRHNQYCCDAAHAMHRYKPTRIVVEIIQDEVTRRARERQLILEYNPVCNQRL